MKRTLNMTNVFQNIQIEQVEEEIVSPDLEKTQNIQENADEGGYESPEIRQHKKNIYEGYNQENEYKQQITNRILQGEKFQENNNNNNTDAESSEDLEKDKCLGCDNINKPSSNINCCREINKQQISQGTIESSITSNSKSKGILTTPMKLNSSNNSSNNNSGINFKIQLEKFRLSASSSNKKMADEQLLRTLEKEKEEQTKKEQRNELFKGSNSIFCQSCCSKSKQQITSSNRKEWRILSEGSRNLLSNVTGKGQQQQQPSYSKRLFVDDDEGEDEDRNERKQQIVNVNDWDNVMKKRTIMKNEQDKNNVQGCDSQVSEPISHVKKKLNWDNFIDKVSNQGHNLKISDNGQTKVSYQGVSKSNNNNKNIGQDNLFQRQQHIEEQQQQQQYEDRNTAAKKHSLILNDLDTTAKRNGSIKGNIITKLSIKEEDKGYNNTITSTQNEQFQFVREFTTAGTNENINPNRSRSISPSINQSFSSSPSRFTDTIELSLAKGKSVMLPSYENELRPENEESMWNLELNRRNSEVALEGPSQCKNRLSDIGANEFTEAMTTTNNQNYQKNRKISFVGTKKRSQTLLLCQIPETHQFQSNEMIDQPIQIEQPYNNNNNNQVQQKLFEEDEQEGDQYNNNSNNYNNGNNNSPSQRKQIFNTTTGNNNLFQRLLRIGNCSAMNSHNNSGIFNKQTTNSSNSPSNSPSICDWSVLREQKLGTNKTSRFSRDFKVLSTIKHSQYSALYKCESIVNGLVYAVKSLTLPKDPDAEEHMIQQIQGLAKVSAVGCGLVKFYNAWAEEDKIYLVMEHCVENLRQIRKPSEQVVRQLMRDVCESLEFLHASFGYAHLGIKPENILLSKKGKFKLSDLGGLSSISSTSSKTIESYYPYMAPELAGCLALSAKVSSAKADIFAFGAVLYEIVTDMELPKYGTEWENLRSGRLSRLMNSVRFSASLKNLIKSMLLRNPQLRPSAADILNQIPPDNVHELELKYIQQENAQLQKKLDDLVKSAQEKQIILTNIPKRKGSC